MLAPVQSVVTYFDGITQRDICEKTANVKRTHEGYFVFDVQVLHEISERKRVLDTMFLIFLKSIDMYWMYKIGKSVKDFLPLSPCFDFILYRMRRSWRMSTGT